MEEFAIRVKINNSTEDMINDWLFKEIMANLHVLHEYITKHGPTFLPMTIEFGTATDEKV